MFRSLYDHHKVADNHDKKLKIEVYDIIWIWYMLRVKILNIFC
jgi:hypothetical protein